MKKLSLLLILLSAMATAFGQEASEYKRSFFQYNENSDYYYCLPWNYNTLENTTESYPLVIYLHGGGGLGDVAGLDFLGYSEEGQPQSKVSKEFQTLYTSFVLVPKVKQGWNPADLIPLVEEFKSKYRIDQKRIYLIGYSMGGSGTYIIANGYYDYNKTLFAGIIRLAGQSQSVLRDELTQNTSVWLHIGLEDELRRVEISREAYDFFKEKNPDAIESSERIKINDRTGITKSIIRNGVAIFKLSEYNQTGHEVHRFPFDNNEVMDWLFAQTLK